MRKAISLLLLIALLADPGIAGIGATGATLGRPVSQQHFADQAFIALLVNMIKPITEGPRLQEIEWLTALLVRLHLKKSTQLIFEQREHIFLPGPHEDRPEALFMQLKKFVNFPLMFRTRLAEMRLRLPDESLDSIIEIFDQAIPNAIDATAQANKDLGMVRIAAYLEDQDIILEIEDEGIGIPPGPPFYPTGSKSRDDPLLGERGEGVSKIQAALWFLEGSRVEIDTHDARSGISQRKIAPDIFEPSQRQAGTLWRFTIPAQHWLASATEAPQIQTATPDHEFSAKLVQLPLLERITLASQIPVSIVARRLSGGGLIASDLYGTRLPMRKVVEILISQFDDVILHSAVSKNKIQLHFVNGTYRGSISFTKLRRNEWTTSLESSAAPNHKPDGVIPLREWLADERRWQTDRITTPGSTSAQVVSHEETIEDSSDSLFDMVREHEITPARLQELAVVLFDHLSHFSVNSLVELYRRLEGDTINRIPATELISRGRLVWWLTGQWVNPEVLKMPLDVNYVMQRLNSISVFTDVISPFPLFQNRLFFPDTDESFSRRTVQLMGSDAMVTEQDAADRITQGPDQPAEVTTYEGLRIVYVDIHPEAAALDIDAPGPTVIDETTTGRQLIQKLKAENRRLAPWRWWVDVEGRAVANLDTPFTYGKHITLFPSAEDLRDQTPQVGQSAISWINLAIAAIIVPLATWWLSPPTGIQTILLATTVGLAQAFLKHEGGHWIEVCLHRARVIRPMLKRTPGYFGGFSVPGSRGYSGILASFAGIAIPIGLYNEGFITTPFFIAAVLSDVAFGFSVMDWFTQYRDSLNQGENDPRHYFQEKLSPKPWDIYLENVAMVLASCYMFGFFGLLGWHGSMHFETLAPGLSSALIYLIVTPVIGLFVWGLAGLCQLFPAFFGILLGYFMSSRSDKTTPSHHKETLVEFHNFRVSMLSNFFEISSLAKEFKLIGRFLDVGDTRYHVIGISHGPPHYTLSVAGVRKLVIHLQELSLPLFSEQNFQSSYRYRYGAEIADHRHLTNEAELLHIKAHMMTPWIVLLLHLTEKLFYMEKTDFFNVQNEAAQMEKLAKSARDTDIAETARQGASEAKEKVILVGLAHLLGVLENLLPGYLQFLEICRQRIAETNRLIQKEEFMRWFQEEIRLKAIAA